MDAVSINPISNSRLLLSGLPGRYLFARLPNCAGIPVEVGASEWSGGASIPSLIGIRSVEPFPKHKKIPEAHKSLFLLITFYDKHEIIQSEFSISDSQGITNSAKSERPSLSVKM